MGSHIQNDNSLQSILDHLEQLSKSLCQDHRTPSFQNQAIEIKLQLEQIYTRINSKRDEIVVSLDRDFQNQKNAYATYLAQEEVKKIQNSEIQLREESIAQSEAHFRAKNTEISNAINTMRAAILEENRFNAELNVLISGTSTAPVVNKTVSVPFPSTTVIQDRNYRIRLVEDFAKEKRLELYGSLEDQLNAFQTFVSSFERRVISLHLGYGFVFVSNLTITVIIDPHGANIASDWLLRITNQNARNLGVYKLGKIPEYPIVLGQNNPDKLYQIYRTSPILEFIQVENEKTSWDASTEFEIYSDALKLTIPLSRHNVNDF